LREFRFGGGVERKSKNRKKKILPQGGKTRMNLDKRGEGGEWQRGAVGKGGPWGRKKVGHRPQNIEYNKTENDILNIT